MPLHVIGLGVSEQANLDKTALAALQTSSRVIGSKRQLDTVRRHVSEKQKVEVLPKLSILKDQLTTYLDNNEAVALLASGDPLFFGIGKWVREHFPGLTHEALYFYAGVSSIQVACHRLGWSLQDVSVISLHGRPLNTLTSALKPNGRYILLTDKHSDAQSIARVCKKSGFHSAVLTVCEKLGYTDEKVRQFSLAELLEGSAKDSLFDALNIVCVQTQKSNQYIPAFPGIPDPHFVTDKPNGKGMITKRQVRLAILSLLEPAPNDCIWDVGAGCGGVATELALWGQGARVYAVEHHEERLNCLRQNQQRFGVERRMTIIEGTAPAICNTLPAANKVFIGGSGGQLSSLLTLAWEQLPPGGMIVASAVTETTRKILYEFYQSGKDENTCFETFEVAISHGKHLAGELYYKPNVSVTLYKFVKERMSVKDQEHVNG